MTSKLISDLARAIRNRSLDDVLVTGFIEKDAQPLQFCANYRTLYFDCGGVFLKSSVVRDEGELSLAIVDGPIADSYPEDEDLLPAMSSVREVVLFDPNGSNSLVSVHLWNVRENGSGIVSAALRFDLSNGQKIFVDPSYFFGMRIGNAQQEQIWNEGFRRPDWAHLEVPLSAVLQK
jgi:hypothetical protein